MNEPPQETDRATRGLIDAIAKLNELEPKISQCRTIDEVEDIRLYSQRIQTYYREVDQFNTLVEWAKRVAGLCQLQITKIQEERITRRNGHRSEGPMVGPALTKQQRENARPLASIPGAGLQVPLDQQQSNSGIQPRKVAEQIRDERKAAGIKKVPKSTPEQLASARARYYRNKAKKAAAGKPGRSPGHRFIESFWPKAEQLLRRLFSLEELDRVAVFWNREFENFRMEAIQARQERKEAFAKLKAINKPAEAGGAAPADE